MAPPCISCCVSALCGVDIIVDTKVRKGVQNDQENRQSRVAALVVLGLISVLGIALRLHTLDRALWVDEILSYRTAAEGFWPALTTVYYLLTYTLMHFMIKLGGSEILIRVPSLLAGIAAIPLIYRFVARAHSRSAGLVAAFVLAVSAMHVQFSQDARFYAFLSLAGLLTVWSLWNIVERNHRKDWFVYAGAVVIGSLDHPFFLTFLAPTIAGVMVCLLVSKRFTAVHLRRAFALLLLTAIALIPLALAYWNFTVHRPDRVRILSVLNEGPARQLRLEPLQYFRFYGEFLFMGMWGPVDVKVLPKLFYVMTIPTLCMLNGVFWLIRRRSALAAVALAGAILQPLPLFFIPVTHWYLSKYLICQMPLAILFLSVGVAAIADSAGGAWCRWRQRRAGRKSSSDLLKLLVVCVLVASFEIFGMEAVITWFRMASTMSWPRVAAREMAGYMSGSDTVFHMPPQDIASRGDDPSVEPTLIPLVHYLRTQAVPASRHDLYPTDHIDVLRPEVVMARLLGTPDKQIWLMYRNAPSAVAITPLLRTVMQQRRFTRDRLLYVAGPPTENLVAGGDIESAAKNGVQTLGSVRPVKSDARPQAGDCFEMSTRNSRDVTSVSFALRSPTCVLRNAAFRVWDKKLPKGWEVASGQADRLGEAGLPGIRLSADEKTTACVSQTFALPFQPLKSLQVKAYGSSSKGGGLTIRVSAVQGPDRLIAASGHEGGAAWSEEVSAELQFDSTKSGGMATVELIQSGAPVDVTSVTVACIGERGLLAPGDYVLSAMVKADLVHEKVTSRPAVVRFVGRTLSGKQIAFEHPANIYGEYDWRVASFPLSVDPGSDLADAAELSVQFVLQNARGRMWLEDVQFERGTRPTPFVNGRRLPHDEEIALVMAR